MSTRPRRTVPAKSYVDAADSDVEMGSSGEERGGVERGGKRGRGGKSRKRASRRDVEGSDGAASVKRARRTKGSAARKKADDSDSDDEAPPPKKRKRRSNKKQKPPAELQIFNTMPLDILSEICSHLDPPDLLHLRKTLKLFYQVLVAPGSKGIWRSARLRTGFRDLGAGDMSEMQYAELVFGTGCQHCDAKTTCWDADYGLRQRLCGPCEKVKVLARRSNRWEGWTGNLKPVEYLSRRLADLGYFIPELWDLQELDDADEDRRASLLNPRISRTRTRGATPTTSLLDEEPHESRVEICVAGRREFVTRMREDGAKVWKVARAYDLAAREAKSEEADRKRYIAYGRRGAIKTKLVKLGWSYFDFTGAWYTSTVVNKAEPLTDEVWERIKPSLIKLLGKIKAEREADRLARNKRRRRDHLRNSYNVLLHAVAEDERAFFPLLGDFVFLSTARKFWEPDDATFSETAWAHNLDEVFEGIHQHSKAVYAEAARIVLAATTENDYDELDEDPSAYDIETYEAAFSDKPTSYLFCALPTCHHFRRRKRAYFGSLPDLLQQQHDVHSSDEFDCLGIGHFRLPVGVASTVSAVTELAGLANDTATAKDLNALSWRLRWDNVFARQKWRTWDELAASIDKRLRKIPKNSIFAVPVIVLDP